MKMDGIGTTNGRAGRNKRKKKRKRRKNANNGKSTGSEQRNCEWTDAITRTIAWKNGGCSLDLDE